MLELLKKLWSIFSSIMIIGLAFVFVRWYIKGHFGKWAIFFWLNTILSISMFYYRKSNIPPPDTRTGAEVWEQNH